MEAEQPGLVLRNEMTGQRGIHPIAHRFAGVARLAPFILLFQGDAGRLALLDHGWSGVLHEGGLVEHIGNRPVQCLRPARGGPAYARGAQPRVVRHVIDGGRLHDLVLVEDGVGNVRNALLLLAIEIVVGDHAVLAGLHAGHQRGVVRPGVGRQGGLHALGPRPFGSQLANERHRRLRIVEVVVRQPIHADEDDVAIGVRGSEA